ncbi:D-glycero-beta-D-manno-heptose 1-phosphate adenylyltransferase [Hyphobacterium sp. HN65]|uniref:Bifunctional protein HldE n=1 Tax=Hyphobacterium lacteum TaxID=3116575 RepID=A0ABU7LM79_9PROT|nr:D-glycero-beta-D-manno-heptose 1-phosphate adenylyltransferase [Hyphobacterium sp. HN65]MEE2524983.1 D-glycero-beta-D-manno-heptose 1-phosphate adenylyltransferase [Hyphobacterium sp. HN65]
MDIRSLSNILDKAAGLKVLCVGDVVLDRFVYGGTHRVSREAPVPVLDEDSVEHMLGGAGNVIRNLRALGARASLVSLVGDDAEGREVSERLRSEHAGDHMVVSPDRPTPVKTRFVSNGHQMLCVDRNPKTRIDTATVRAVLEQIETCLADADIVILSDYGRGLVTPEISSGLMKLARVAGKRVCVDPRGRDFTRYDGAHLIKPNALELYEESGIDPVDDGSAAEALNAVFRKLSNVDHLIVTRGSKGMSITDGDAVSHVRARPRQVYDVSGAGDTAIAMLAVALGAGANLRAAMEAAVHASGEVVTKVGTATVTPADLVSAAGGGRSTQDMPLEEAVETVARWRAHGLKIGFTNGCFDILHAGHVSYLEKARTACDRLIVGLNSDASVRRLKGEGRPVNDAAARAAVLLGLASVDQVVVFEQDTPESLLDALRPDVYLKGADYTEEQLLPLGGRIVKSYGGEIQLIPLVEGKSTTGIIDQLKKP